jgi:hypothetical protein
VHRPFVLSSLSASHYFILSQSTLFRNMGHLLHLQARSCSWQLDWMVFLGAKDTKWRTACGGSWIYCRNMCLIVSYSKGVAWTVNVSLLFRTANGGVRLGSLSHGALSDKRQETLSRHLPPHWFSCQGRMLGEHPWIPRRNVLTDKNPFLQIYHAVWWQHRAEPLV